jgi:hypothetical protein
LKTSTTILSAALAVASIPFSAAQAADSDAASRALAPVAQNVAQQAQALDFQNARGDFNAAGYNILQITAEHFVNEHDGTALSYDSKGYFYRPTKSLNPPAAESLYQTQLSLPQGSQICWMSMYTYDNDTTANRNIRLRLKELTGYGEAVSSSSPPVGTYLDEVSSDNLPASHYGYYSVPIGGLLGCRTINNNVRYANGAQYLLELTIPESAETDLMIKAVDIWWKRQISPAPATATFSDVPTTHTFFQYVEALKASGITSGTSPTTYSPEAYVTRGQMAAFLARALGL